MKTKRFQEYKVDAIPMRKLLKAK